SSSSDSPHPRRWAGASGSASGSRSEGRGPAPSTTRHHPPSGASMPVIHRTVAVFGLALLAGAACAPAATVGASSRPAADSAALVAEARAFMDAYATDLRTGARDRLGERYDPRGAWFVGEGRKDLLPADSIRAMYRGGWRPPASFDWQDLSYEVVGPDAVVVAGRFLWGISATERLRFSYTSLLLRRDGRFR